MDILVKFPCRERPQKLLQRITEYQSLSEDKNIQYLISLDSNDLTMNAYVLGRLQALGVTVCLGHSNNKIHACNRDIDKASEWDILVLASDDMVCIQQGWDSILKAEMAINFPDTDGVLFHWDGDRATKAHNNGAGLNTMCILGKKYYDRFGYIYHPDYKSLWSDNEFSDVSRILNKEYKSDIVLFKHDHYSNNGQQPDNLMRKTQSFYTEDQQTYLKRKAVNFGL